jgi:regulator of protease activity HflC (stomatin/prohibitin superfamily)
MSRPDRNQDVQARISLKEAEVVAALAGIVQLLLGIGTLLFALWSRSLSGFAEGWHLLAGAGLWLLLFVHQRVRRLAAEEEQEMAELARTAGPEQRARLFEAEGVEPFSARTRRDRFQKFVLPALTALGALLLVLIAWLIVRHVRRAVIEPGTARHLPTLALMWTQALLCLLLGKYAAGMARQKPWRSLRAGGGYMLANALVCFLVGAGQGAGYYFRLPQVDRWLAWGVAAALLVLAIEVLLNLLLDFYRPRVPGAETRFPYDSRLLGLLTEPAGIMRTAAATLDYQFGFKVSETWFYRFMERAIAPLVLFQLLTLYLLTSFVIVGSDQQAVIERLGRYKGRPCGPGLYLKLPWPFEHVWRYPAQRVHAIRISGDEQHTRDDEDHDHGPHDVIWAAQTHHRHGFFMVAARTAPTERESDPTVAVSYLAGAFTVQYRVRDVEKFHYGYEDPEDVLRVAARREILQYLASVDFDAFLGPELVSAAGELRDRIQQAADTLELGVDILFISCEDVHPPAGTAEAFEQVIAAQIERDDSIARARSHAAQLRPRTDAEAATILARAAAAKFRRTEISRQEAWRFQQQVKAWHLGREVFLRREYLATLREVLRDARKILVPVAADGQRVLVINAEEKAAPEFLTAPPPE